jgi:hypothetical protein
MPGTYLDLYHATRASSVGSIRKRGLHPSEESRRSPETHWMLTSSKEDAWQHARTRPVGDRAVITYAMPKSQFDDYLYPPWEVVPTVTFYSLRRPLPGSMIKAVDAHCPDRTE